MTTKNKISLPIATLMVAGNMMGSGVFMLPANLAKAGSISIISWLLTTVGAVALALIFGKLAAIDPADGGPYAYTRKAYGNYMGFQTNLVYWLAGVIGNVALVVAGMGYLVHFFPSLSNPLVMMTALFAVTWFCTYLNLLGPRIAGRIQSVTVVLALIPLLGVAFLGWFWFKPDVFIASWNTSGHSSMSAIGMSLNYTLWAFIGVESASVSAGVVENPSRNVPIATIGGVLIAAICYIFSSAVIMGMIPNSVLVASSAPFSDAVRIALGNAAANTVAIIAAITCLGSLSGWILLMGQTAKAATGDGLFPSLFGKVNKKGVPTWGILVVGIIMSALIFLTASPNAATQFGKITSIAVILTLLPYIYSATSFQILAHGKIANRQYQLFTWIGMVAAVYSICALIASDVNQTRWALLFVIATIIFYHLTVSKSYQPQVEKVSPDLPTPAYVNWIALAVMILSVGAMIWFSQT